MTTSSPRGSSRSRQKPSNVAKMVRFAKGDVEAGFKEADLIVERRYTDATGCTRAISSRMLASYRSAADGQTTIFSSSQGQFMVRSYTARICGGEIADIRAIPAEIGGRVRPARHHPLEPRSLFNISLYFERK